MSIRIVLHVSLIVSYFYMNHDKQLLKQRLFNDENKARNG